MRKCNFVKREYEYISGKRTLVTKTHTGNFIQWGCDFVEFENDTGNYTAGIIEMSDGKIELIRADDIQFVDDAAPINHTADVGKMAESAPEKCVGCEFLAKPRESFCIRGRDDKNCIKQ
jgi:hypothetical protein